MLKRGFFLATVSAAAFLPMDKSMADTIRIREKNVDRIHEISNFTKFGLQAACLQLEADNRLKLGVVSGNRLNTRPAAALREAILASGTPKNKVSDLVRASLKEARQDCRSLIDQAVLSRLTLIPDFSEYGLQAACYKRAFRDQIMLGVVDGNRFRPRPKRFLGNALRDSDLKRGEKEAVIRRTLRTARASCEAELEAAKKPLRPGKGKGSQPAPAPAEPTPVEESQPTPVPAEPTPGDVVSQPAPAPIAMPAIPYLAQWESRMLSFGQARCNQLTSGNLTWDQALDAVYYDGQWVYFQIMDYIGSNQPYWNNCAQTAETIYRDNYVFPANGVVQGFRNFTHGLIEDYLRTGDDLSRQAAIMCSTNGAYAGDQFPLSWTQHVDLSRETAYAVMSYLNAEKVGAQERTRLNQMVAQIYGHFDQWFVTKSAPYIRPFMVALSSHALIMYHDKTGDPNVVPTLTMAMDWIWDNMWLPSAESFKYTDRNLSHGGMEPAPDLNLLIAPTYAWLYKQTGQARFLERGDQIFVGGVKNAWLGNGKQFNQNYRWSFDYVKWRGGK